MQHGHVEVLGSNHLVVIAAKNLPRTEFDIGFHDKTNPTAWLNIYEVLENVSKS